MLRSAESKHPRLGNREIIYEEFKPACMIIIHHCYMRTERRLVIAIPHSAQHRVVKSFS